MSASSEANMERQNLIKRLNALTDLLSDDDLNELCNQLDENFKQEGI